MPKPLDYALGGWQMVGAWYFQHRELSDLPCDERDGTSRAEQPNADQMVRHIQVQRPAGVHAAHQSKDVPGCERTRLLGYSSVLRQDVQVGERTKFMAKVAAYN